MVRFYFFVAFLTSIGAEIATAEPWLGNRFAQNCAGCHAPGRKNLPPIDRRCTLSCQGCHVNPSGGGMRSFYGKWNQNRWLRSFRTSLTNDTKSVAPTRGQEYGKKKYRKRRKRSGDRRDYQEGFALNEISQTYPDVSKYDRGDMLEHVTAGSWREFHYQVPDGDPYREFERSRVDAGGDLRWMWRSLQSESNSSDDVPDSAVKWQNFMMSFDFGVRYRPVHRYLHLVYEGRMFGSPAPEAQFKDQANTAGTRSLYAMIDNLPFNSYIQGGWYRPLIGSSGPDHNLLSQRMLSYALSGSPRGQSLLFNAVSVGTAPNVPFGNIHYIRRRKTIGGDIQGDRTEGFAVNMGLRFVTLGAAVNYTYWKTQDTNKLSGDKTEVEIYTLGASAQVSRFTVGLEAMSFAREVDTADFRRGGVYQLETRTQLWREYYALAHYAMGNTTSDLLPGSSTQIKVGLRGFHLAGVESMVTYDIDTEATDGKKGSTENERTTSYITGQLHVYF